MRKLLTEVPVAFEYPSSQAALVGLVPLSVGYSVAKHGPRERGFSSS